MAVRFPRNSTSRRSEGQMSSFLTALLFLRYGSRESVSPSTKSVCASALLALYVSGGEPAAEAATNLSRRLPGGASVWRVSQGLAARRGSVISLPTSSRKRNRKFSQICSTTGGRVGSGSLGGCPPWAQAEAR